MNNLDSIEKELSRYKESEILKHYTQTGEVFKSLVLEYLIFKLNGITYVISYNDKSKGYILTDEEGIEDYYIGFSKNELKRVIDRLSLTKFAS